MTGGNGTVAERARQVVAKRAGPTANATVLADAARRTYDDLARVSAPLIGQMGVDAVMSRAVHLARRQYPWLISDHAGSLGQEDGAFAQVARCLEQSEARVAGAAAAAVFALSAGLLATLIGDTLTVSLLHKAWPDAFPMPTKRSDNE